MKFILHWIVYALAILITTYILPGVHITGLITVLVLAIVLGAINAVVRPILIVLTLPLSIFTFGLFIFVINALLIMLAAAIVPGFSVAGFWWALLFSIILSIISGILGGITEEAENK